MMPNLLQFDPTQIIGFVVIFTRITGIMVISPILGDTNIPMQIKVAIAFVFSLVFFPVVGAADLGPNPELSRILYVAVTEFGLGLVMGFAVRMLFTGVSLAGEVAGFQMGVGVANIFDPSSEQQVSLIGQIQVIFALLLFVTLDGHHLLIKSLVESYAIVPPGGLALSEQGMRFFVAQAGNIFLIGLQIGAPLIVALLAANFSMGLIARSVPQMNVIVVGFPFSIGLGLLFLFLGFPYFMRSMMVIIERLDDILMAALKLLG
ncbi:MAG: flagellar biosynthetic protein FliR [SAR324 cluster bacterium]|nr:flagellar biosynthetic protein FliR [SAR324 cluster bacterium]